MANYSIERSGLPPLEFSGRSLAHSQGCRDNPVTLGRWHDIHVYQADDGQYIVNVQFHSPLETEMSDSIADAVDELADVDDLLSLYDPTERLDREVLGSAMPKVSLAVTAMVRAFDQQVTTVLNEINFSQQITAVPETT